MSAYNEQPVPIALTLRPKYTHANVDYTQHDKPTAQHIRFEDSDAENNYEQPSKPTANPSLSPNRRENYKIHTFSEIRNLCRDRRLACPKPDSIRPGWQGPGIREAAIASLIRYDEHLPLLPISDARLVHYEPLSRNFFEGTRRRAQLGRKATRRQATAAKKAARKWRFDLGVEDSRDGEEWTYNRVGRVRQGDGDRIASYPPSAPSSRLSVRDSADNKTVTIRGRDTAATLSAQTATTTAPTEVAKGGSDHDTFAVGDLPFRKKIYD